MQVLDKIKEALRDRVAAIVAQNTGLSAQTINDIRAGRTVPKLETIDTLAKYLGIKI